MTDRDGSGTHDVGNAAGNADWAPAGRMGPARGRADDQPVRFEVSEEC